MLEESAMDYASVTSSGLDNPVGLSRGYTEAKGKLDNPSSKKRYGPRTRWLKYTVSSYETPLQGGGHRPMPWVREFYDILEQAGLDTDIIETCHEFFDDREIHVEFKDEFSKTLAESTWLDKALVELDSKATILPRRFDDTRTVHRRRVPCLPSRIQAIDVQKEVQHATPDGVDVLRSVRQVAKPFKLSRSGKIVKNLSFGGVLLDILADDIADIPACICRREVRGL